MNTKFVKHMNDQERRMVEEALQLDGCANIDTQEAVIRFTTKDGIQCELFSTDFSDPIDGISMYVPLERLLSLYEKAHIHKPRHSTSINKRLDEGKDEEEVMDLLWKSDKSSVEGTYSLEPDPSVTWFFKTDARTMYHRKIHDKHHIIFDSGSDGQQSEPQVYEVKPNEVLAFGSRSPNVVFENTNLLFSINKIAMESGDM